MVFQQETTISGTDVSSYVLGWSILKGKDDVDNNKAIVRLPTDVNTVQTFNVGSAITISKGFTNPDDFRLFTGIIHSFDYSGGLVTAVCRNPLYMLRYKLVTKSYDINIDSQARVISAIAEDLITSIGGLSARVVDSGSVLVLQKFICNDDTVLERLQALAKVLNWQLYWDDSTEEVVFEPEGTTSYSTNLVVGDNVVNMPDWVTDKENMRNKFKVKGAVRRDTVTELFSGDASNVTFQLSKVPKDTNVDVGGVRQIRGVENASEDYDYKVDEDQKQIIFVVASTPGVGVDNVSVTYTTDVDNPVTASNQASIDSYGEQEGANYFDDIRTVADAELRASKIIEKIGVPFNRTALSTIGCYGLLPAMKVHIVDVQQGQELDLTVQAINYRFPEGYDIVDVGDEDWRLNAAINNLSARIRELERQEVTNLEILTEIVDFSRSIIAERRYMVFQSQDVSMDGAWGLGFGDGVSRNDYVWGEAGGIWQSGFTNAPVDELIVQNNNIYREYFYDEDFKGTGTATWDTSSFQLSFTSGQIHTTDFLSLGVAYSYFTVRLGTLVGSLLVEISGDGGSSWQTVTVNTRTLFASSSASGVKIRITEDNSSTASITSTQSADGYFTSPGITLILEE